jgi:hypothetical protein
MSKVKVGRIRHRYFAYVGRIRVVTGGGETKTKDKGEGEGYGGGSTTQ